MTRKPASKKIDSLTFEQAYQELEDCVAKLEGGELPLDESLAVYERGQALAAYCGKMLDEAELKIEKLEE